jgi:hypothetical protein
MGSGTGSMAPALVMRAAGKSALILGKTEFVGDTKAKSGREYPGARASIGLPLTFGRIAAKHPSDVRNHA